MHEVDYLAETIMGEGVSEHVRLLKIGEINDIKQKGETTMQRWHNHGCIGNLGKGALFDLLINQ